MIKVEMGQKHLEFGKRYNTTCCPAAVAIKEATDATEVFVTHTCTTVSHGNHHEHYRTPDILRAFMWKWDITNRAKPDTWPAPVSFTLDEKLKSR